MNPIAIKDYINRLPFNNAFISMSDDVQEKIMFGSYEMLRRRYGIKMVTDEMTALQSIYVAEGEKEEFAKFKRQNVTTMRVEDLQFTFEKGTGNNISPEVAAIVEAAKEVAAAEAAVNETYFGRLF